MNIGQLQTMTDLSAQALETGATAGGFNVDGRDGTIRDSKGVEVADASKILRHVVVEPDQYEKVPQHFQRMLPPPRSEAIGPPPQNLNGGGKTDRNGPPPELPVDVAETARAFLGEAEPSERQRFVFSMTGQGDGKTSADLLHRVKGTSEFLAPENMERVFSACDENTDLVWTDHGGQGMVGGDDAKAWARVFFSLGLRTVGKLSVVACDSAKLDSNGRCFVSELARELHDLGVQFREVKGRIGEVGVRPEDGKKVVRNDQGTFHKTQGTTQSYQWNEVLGVVEKKPDIYQTHTEQVEASKDVIFLPRPPTLFPGGEQGNHVTAFALVRDAVQAMITVAANGANPVNDLQALGNQIIGDVNGAVAGTVTTSEQIAQIIAQVARVRTAMQNIAGYGPTLANALRDELIALENLHPLAASGIGSTGGAEGNALRVLNTLETQAAGGGLNAGGQRAAVEHALTLVDTEHADQAAQNEGTARDNVDVDQGTHLPGARLNGNHVDVEATREAIADRHVAMLEARFPNVVLAVGAAVIRAAIIERFENGTDE